MPAAFFAFTAKPEGEWFRTWRVNCNIKISLQTKKNMVQYTYFCGMHEACAVLRRVHIYLQLKRYKCLSKLGRVLMLWSKGILPPTDIHELLRCYATFAILKTFGFADFLWKSLHPHVFAGPKLKTLIVQARTAFGAFDPSITSIRALVLAIL